MQQFYDQSFRIQTVYPAIDFALAQKRKNFPKIGAKIQFFDLEITKNRKMAEGFAFNFSPLIGAKLVTIRCQIWQSKV